MPEMKSTEKILVQAKINGFLLFPAKLLGLSDGEPYLRVSTSSPSGVAAGISEGLLKGPWQTYLLVSALKARIWVYEETEA